MGADGPPPDPGLEGLVCERIRRFGTLRFDDVVDAALYHPQLGFYSRGGQAGRRGDFITSPEVGPLFGAVIAQALDTWWGELGRPDPYLVVEAGAGRGALARAVLDALPDCIGALRYVLVEQSAPLRDAQRELLPITRPADALGPQSPERGDDGEARSLPGTGPVVVSLAEMPASPFTGVILANELLDNLPFRLVERREGAWWEVRVGSDERGEMVEVVVPADAATSDLMDRLAPDAADGSRAPLQERATAWTRDALALLERGRLVVVDYADTTAGMAARPPGSWLRTYRGHASGSGPLDHLGDQDVTVEVAVDQLARAEAPGAVGSQADFLRDHGIDALVEEGRSTWRDRAHRGDLAAVRGASRVGEAEALLDPGGLGAFRVMQWLVPQPSPRLAQ